MEAQKRQAKLKDTLQWNHGRVSFFVLLTNMGELLRDNFFVFQC